MPVVSRVRRVTPRARTGTLPLSFAQEGLWFEQTLDPGNHAFNELLTLRLEDAVRPDQLARALNQLVVRHEALRTEFREDASGPVQIVLPNLRIALPLVDLTTMPRDDARASYFRAARSVRLEPFDLRHAPLLRALVFRLAPTEHIVLIAVHHIVCDGWSIDILLRELDQLFESESTGVAPRLPEPILQYGDYAIWDRESLTDEAMTSLLAFWGERLSDPPAFELPADRPARSIGTSPAHWVRINLDRELSDALRALSQRERTTLSTTLLASFFIVLHRFAGQDDLVVGLPITTREQRALQQVIGFFVNTLALRAQVSEAVSFRQFLSTLTRDAFDAYAHQRLPFERLVHYLRQEHGLTGPLFQVVWAFHNTPRHTLRSSGLALGSMPTPMREVTQADLECQVWAWPGGINCRLVYRSDRYDEVTIIRLLDSWKTLLRNIVSTSPDRRLSELSAVSAADRGTLLTWAGTPPTHVADSLAIDLFEAHVSQTPDRIAVADGPEQVTYRVLNDRANHLARHLADLGVGPDVRVALCLERRLPLMVAVLAIWKAGGAYVPLDPAHPPDRLALMLDDASAPIVLTEASLRDVLPATWAHVVVLPLPASDAEMPVTPPARRGSPLNLAYVIYTSGSTGRPKAVCVTHQGYVNLVRAQEAILGAGDGERVLQFSSFSFDAAAWEIAVSLLRGGQLVLAGQRRLLGLELIDLCRREQIQTVLLPPSVIASLPCEPLPALATLVTGAEACPAELAGMWSAGRRMFNAYGPTESSVIATMSDPIAGGGRAPAIGRPIPGSQVYVLDASGNLGSPGAVGELVIGGVGLARGYLHRPAETAARFRPDPFSDTPGARLYHTGDLVRWQTDGTLAFLGRRDQQVKLRGFRIELGEIETVLARHPAVQHAVVIARTDASAGPYLVAYAVPVSGRAPTEAELLAHVRAHLPDYMVPAAIVRLDRLPLTPNGKLDVRALPAPDPDGAVIAGDAPPQTPVEEILAGIWTEVLHRDVINRDDDFFILGGQSLLATQVAARVRAALGIDVPLRTLFDMPTLAGFASAVETLRRSATVPAAPRLQPVPRDRPLPLAFAQQRLWFLQQLAPGSAAYHCAAVVRLRGPLDADALHASLNALVTRHEALRTTFVAVDGVPMQVIAPPGPVSLHWIDLTALPATLREAKAQTLAAREARHPFALDRGPLLRVHAIRLAADTHLLLVTLHHIVCDGWSVWLLMRDISRLYRAARTGTPAALPPLPVQYADVAVWQRTWLQQDVLEAQFAYWRRQLGDAPGFDLPADVVEPIAGGDRSRTVALQIEPPLPHAIERLARTEAATVFITLLTALDVVLWAETGGTDLLVGTDIANRSDALTEGLIGFFVNQLVLRTTIDDEHATFRDLLTKNRETALDAFGHQDCPFDKVVEQLRPGKGRGDQPLFSVKMTLQNAPRAALDLPDLQCDVVPPGTGAPKFDLLITVVPRADRWDLSLEYDAARFTRARVTHWGRQILTVLDLATSDPQITLDRLRQRLQHDAETLQRELAAAHRRTVQAALGTLRRVREVDPSQESRL